MGRVNIWLPADLQAEVRQAQLNVSGICQDALRAAVQLGKAGAQGDITRPDPVERTFGCTPSRHLGPIERLGEYANAARPAAGPLMGDLELPGVVSPVAHNQ
jgi:hypothetical protein